MNAKGAKDEGKGARGFCRLPIPLVTVRMR